MLSVQMVAQSPYAYHMYYIIVYTMHVLKRSYAVLMWGVYYTYRYECKISAYMLKLKVHACRPVLHACILFSLLVEAGAYSHRLSCMFCYCVCKSMEPPLIKWAWCYCPSLGCNQLFRACMQRIRLLYRH